ncbi:MAG: MOSC domain-containing protein [Candidatus Riflebacteria bacterium]
MAEKTRGKVSAVCISETVGTSKREVSQCLFIAGRGIEGDGHIDTIRPVSLLMIEDIEEYNSVHEKKAGFGDFAENLVTRGVDLRKARVGDRIKVGDALLEVCQIGKEVLPQHYSFHGDRLLPTRGVFCRVIDGGTTTAGSEIELLQS